MLRTNLKSSEIGDILKDRFTSSDILGHWMVIWIERIYQHPDGNIVAEVALARILETRLTSFSSSKMDFSQLKTITVPTHLLPLISPGLIFKDGLIEIDLHYNYIKPERISINVDAIESTSLASWALGDKLRKKIGLTRTDIPFSTGRKKTFGEKSKIYVIKNTNPSLDAECIVYPSTEIARFYLFRSSIMAQGLIAPRTISLGENIFYVPQSLEYPDHENPYHYLTIRDKMLVRDVHIIARMAFSKEARMAAEEINTSLLNGQSFGNTGSFFLNTFFPFSGETQQKVYGVTLDLDVSKVFLVLEINECYKPFPFSSLRFARESGVPKVNNTLPPVPGHALDPNKSTGRDSDSKKIYYIFNPTFDEDTSRNNKTKNDRRIENAEYVDRRVRYPNLTADIKEVRHEHIIPPKKDKLAIANKPTSNLSQNQVKADQTDSTGLIIASDENPNARYRYPGNYVDRIKLIVRCLVQLGCRVRYHNSIDKHGTEDFSYIYINVDRQQLNSNQRKFSEMSDNVPRRVIAFEIEYFNCSILIIEFEPIGHNAYNVFCKRDSPTPFTYSDVAIIIEEAVTSVGRWDTLPRTYKKKKLYHGISSPNEYAIRILKAFGFYKKEGSGDD